MRAHNSGSDMADGLSIRGLVVRASFLLLVGCLLLTPEHSAAQLAVDSTADRHDAVPGDGVCDDGLGGCTLRAAIEEANQMAGEQVISFDVSGVFGLNDPSSTIPIDDHVQIIGPGSDLMTVRQDLVGGIFLLTSSLPNVTISGMTFGGVQTGSALQSPAGSNLIVLGSVFENNHLAVNGGPAIATQGQVLVDGCLFENNSAPGSGGAIQITGSGGTGNVTIKNSVLQSNQTTGGNGGAISVELSQHFLLIEDSELVDNSAPLGSGGAISAVGTLEIGRTLISGNSASESLSTSTGGGIRYVDTSATPHSFTMAHSVVSFNTAAHHGGGIEILTSMAVEISNSTIAENETQSFGGGLALANTSAESVVANSTITSNSALTGGGLTTTGTTTLNHVTTFGNHGGGLEVSSGTTTLLNSIVAHDSAGESQGTGPDCSGLGVAAVGPNLDSDGSCGASITDSQPGIAPSTTTVGLTPTHPLLDGSPAIDAADAAVCAAAPILNRDQRGVVRPVGLACDLGAHEGGVTIFRDGFESGDTSRWSGTV